MTGKISAEEVAKAGLHFMSLVQDAEASEIRLAIDALAKALEAEEPDDHVKIEIVIDMLALSISLEDEAQPQS